MDRLDQLISESARTLCSVAPGLPQHAMLAQELEDATRASERGYFLADEDERVRGAFARYLGVRAALLATVADLEPVFESNTVPYEQRLRIFAIAFCSACMLMRSARFLVDNFAPLKIVWHKLDEAEPRFGIPRKQFSAIYSSATLPSNVWRFYRAVQFARENGEALRSLESCPVTAPVLALLEAEKHDAIQISKLAETRSRIRYLLHSWRRRRKSTFKQITFAIFEASGRSIAEMQNPFHRKRVTPDIIRAARRILQPGDAIVTRHDDAMSNLFLPGYWPHGALFIGNRKQRRQLGTQMSDERWQRSSNPARVLEARKDGVRFRPLTDTLRVDAFTIIRPKLAPTDIAIALSRAAEHEGKLYDFEFDFARADRLVCTEVIYRGFHAVGGLEFPLTQRAGRPTFSAEDLLDMAVDGRGYEVVAAYGVGGINAFVEGTDARQSVMASYRPVEAPPVPTQK